MSNFKKLTLSDTNSNCKTECGQNCGNLTLSEDFLAIPDLFLVFFLCDLERERLFSESEDSDSDPDSDEVYLKDFECFFFFWPLSAHDNFEFAEDEESEENLLSFF